jgi:hypothetical protein
METKYSNSVDLSGLSALVRKAVECGADYISISKEPNPGKEGCSFVYKTYLNQDGDDAQKKIPAEFIESAEGRNPDLNYRLKRLQGILEKSHDKDSVVIDNKVWIIPN